jgi:hypothetical protein
MAPAVFSRPAQAADPGPHSEICGLGPRPGSRIGVVFFARPVCIVLTRTERASRMSVVLTNTDQSAKRRLNQRQDSAWPNHTLGCLSHGFSLSSALPIAAVTLWRLPPSHAAPPSRPHRMSFRFSTLPAAPTAFGRPRPNILWERESVRDRADPVTHRAW